MISSVPDPLQAKNHIFERLAWTLWRAHSIHIQESGATEQKLARCIVGEWFLGGPRGRRLALLLALIYGALAHYAGDRKVYAKTEVDCFISSYQNPHVIINDIKLITRCSL